LVNALWRAFGTGSGFCQAIWSIILPKYKKLELMFRALLNNDGTREVRFERAKASFSRGARPAGRRRRGLL
jgi:hypothetical protein